jgi:hypothetical protein
MTVETYSGFIEEWRPESSEMVLVMGESRRTINFSKERVRFTDVCPYSLLEKIGQVGRIPESLKMDTDSEEYVLTGPLEIAGN